MGGNTLVPNRSTFAKAESIIYARALYKPRIPETKSVDTLISDDKKDSVQEKPDIIISDGGILTTADGKKLRSLTFFPKKTGDWEQVAYGEEGDFYLIFTISSKSKKGFDSAQQTYKDLFLTTKNDKASMAASSPGSCYRRETRLDAVSY